MKSVAYLIATATFVGPALSQQSTHGLPTRGMMSSFSAGVVFEGVNNVIGRKHAGLPARVGLFNNGRPNVPEYSGAQIDARLQQMNSNWSLHVEIDAMSTGNDLLPLYAHSIGVTGVPDEYRIYMGNVAGWATLYLAMTPDPVSGGDEGIFGYYFDNPSFPEQLRNGVRYEIFYPEFTSGDMTVPVNPQIAALDVGMGLIDASEGRPVLGVNFETRRLYFSVTPYCASLMSALMPTTLQFDDGMYSVPYQPPGNWPTPSYTGATVFVALFDPVSGDCTEVRVHADYSTLHLDPGEDIDALALIRLPQTSQAPPGATTIEGATFQYVLSTAQSVGSFLTQEPEELVVVATPSGPGVSKKGRLRTRNGDILVGGGGTLRGSVSGVCADDPEGAGAGGVAAAEPKFDSQASGTDLLGLSVHAHTVPTPDSDDDAVSNTAADAFEMKGVVSGWGCSTEEDSLVFVVVEVLGTGLPANQVTMTSMMLPVRLAGDDCYEFTLNIGMPWTLPNSTNRFAVKVIQASIANMAITESYQVLLQRGA